MNINGVEFDVAKCLHNIAMEYAKRDLDQYISEGRIRLCDVTGCLDYMFNSYVQAFGYLSKKDSGYIKSLLEHA